MLVDGIGFVRKENINTSCVKTYTVFQKIRKNKLFSSTDGLYAVCYSSSCSFHTICWWFFMSKLNYLIDARRHQYIFFQQNIFKNVKCIFLYIFFIYITVLWWSIFLCLSTCALIWVKILNLIKNWIRFWSEVQSIPVWIWSA